MADPLSKESYRLPIRFKFHNYLFMNGNRAEGIMQVEEEGNEEQYRTQNTLPNIFMDSVTDQTPGTTVRSQVT
jgi:hypothetical protein